MFVMENIVDHVASTLGLRPEKVGPPKIERSMAANKRSDLMKSTT